MLKALIKLINFQAVCYFINLNNNTGEAIFWRTEKALWWLAYLRYSGEVFYEQFPLKLLSSTGNISILHQLSKKLIVGLKIHSPPLLLLWFIFQEIDYKDRNGNEFYKRIQCCVIINLIIGWSFNIIFMSFETFLSYFKRNKD